VVDSIDVDVTGGEDMDGDGIDDFADADFVLLADVDGDGIADIFDPDFLGTGFSPVTAFNEPVSAENLNDENDNGVIDVLEPHDDTGDAIVRTGLSGSACSIGSGTGTGNGTRDPLFPLLALFATGMVAVRRRLLSGRADK